jgi:transcriptional regulator with XRE-family HTH domain
MNHGPTKREKAQLGRKLKRLREKSGMRVELMAAYLEVTSRTITNYETGHTHASKAVVLAYEHFTGLTMSELDLPVSPCNQGSLFASCGEDISAPLAKAFAAA